MRKHDAAVEQQWVRRICVTSDLEIAAAHIQGFVVSDSTVAEIWANLDADKIATLRSVEEGTALTPLSDKYFALMLIGLFERWFLLDRPRQMLEDLVLDFRESDLLMIGDKMLAPGVAGITEVYQRRTPVDPDEYGVAMRIQKWLGGYVPLLLKHELLLRPLI